MASLEDCAGAEASGGGVVIEAHVKVFDAGAYDAQDRGSEANGGDRGGGPQGRVIDGRGIGVTGSGAWGRGLVKRGSEAIVLATTVSGLLTAWGRHVEATLEVGGPLWLAGHIATFGKVTFAGLTAVRVMCAIASAVPPVVGVARGA